MPGELDNFIKERLGFTDQEVEEINSAMDFFGTSLSENPFLKKQKVLKDIESSIFYHALNYFYLTNRLARPLLTKYILDQDIIAEITLDNLVSKLSEYIDLLGYDNIKDKYLNIANKTEQYRKMQKWVFGTRLAGALTGAIFSIISILIITLESQKMGYDFPIFLVVGMGLFSCIPLILKNKTYNSLESEFLTTWQPIPSSPDSNLEEISPKGLGDLRLQQDLQAAV